MVHINIQSIIQTGLKSSNES